MRKVLADSIFNSFVGRVRTLRNPGEGVIKSRKSQGRGDQNILEIQGEGDIKAKILRIIHKIIEIP